MKFTRHHQQPIGINIAPLLDMVFLLLIFFLLTSSFLVNEGIKINLPAAKSSEVHQDTEIIITITKENKLFLNQNQIDIPTLSLTLPRILRTCPGKVVVIKADREIILEKAVKVLDTAKLAGAQKIVLSSEITVDKSL